MIRYSSPFLYCQLLFNDKAAMFLSCLATNISVGLDSWVETDNEKEVNSEQDALNDILEVLKLRKFKTLNGG